MAFHVGFWTTRSGKRAYDIGREKPLDFAKYITRECFTATNELMLKRKVNGEEQYIICKHRRRCSACSTVCIGILDLVFIIIVIENNNSRIVVKLTIQYFRRRYVTNARL